MIKLSEIKKLDVYTDREIIARILDGETRLYEVIIRRFNSSLYKTGRACGFNHQDTEDLMQETYLDGYTNLKKFENRSSLKTWLTRIMLHNCFQKRKKFSFIREIPTEFGPGQNYRQMFTKKENRADRKVFAGELSRIIERALGEIPLEYRLVFALRELNALSTRETAAALDISENNVRVRLTRAKKMLRRRIERMYSPEDIYEFNLIYCDRIVERVMNRIGRREPPGKEPLASGENL